MDPIGKIHVLHALDNGRSKADIAREYGVHSRIIAYIQQHKDRIIKKYGQKYNALKKVRCINLDLTLTNWLAVQIEDGTNIQESELRDKAQELMNTQCNEDFHCIDDWLQDFQKRHNIAKFSTEIECTPEAQGEWDKFIGGVDVKDVYVTVTCGLYHSHTFEDFVEQKEPKNHVSLLFIVNCMGLDKQQLLVTGQNEVCKGNIRSLPVNYFQGEKSVINDDMIDSFLKKWDENLKIQHKRVLLFVPSDIVNKLHFENIILVNSSEMTFVPKRTQKIIECFKYHYRRLLITRNMLYKQNASSLDFVDYLHLMSAAWQAITASYFRMLFFPPEDGSLYFNSNNFCNGCYSLLRWYRMQTNQLEYDSKENLLDEYVFCDKNLHPLNNEKLNIDMEDINEALIKDGCVESTSSMHAFQAMKRLFAYVQSEHGRDPVLDAARKLENHLECGSMLEIQDICAKRDEEE